MFAKNIVLERYVFNTIVTCWGFFLLKKNNKEIILYDFIIRDFRAVFAMGYVDIPTAISDGNHGPEDE